MPHTFALSDQQQAGVDAAFDWFNNGTSQIFRLFGPAGTGKSTCVESLISRLFPDYDPANPEDRTPVEIATFTAKAASVLRSKGTARARTVHSLIYRAFVIKDPVTGAEQVRFSMNPQSDLLQTRLLILDECSMISEKMARDLLSFDVPILVLGDPAQLPPVFGEGYFTKDAPDHLLTEIHRQAADNPIISLATAIRQSLPYPATNPADPRLRILASLYHNNPYTDYDQIICGRNATCRAINDQTRTLLFGSAPSPLPVPGDKLVCLRNDHNLGILNGVLYECLESSEPNPTTPQYFDLKVRALDDPASPILDITAHTSYFLSRHLNDGKPPADYAAKASHFNFGYAFTCHKSQGSQWGNILVINESHYFPPYQARWLYTAVTRAANSLTLLL